MIQFSDGAGFTSQPLKSDKAAEWLKNHLEEQRKIKEAKNTFKNRFLFMGCFIALPVVFLIHVFTFIPLYLFTGKTLWSQIERIEDFIHYMS